MEFEPPLRLDHIGEALVAALLNAEGTAFADIPFFVPGSDAPHRLGELDAERPHAWIGSQLCSPPDAGPDVPGFDGMHDVDVALVYGERVVAMELKLGETALAPTTFARRFTEPPRLSGHRPVRLSGSMIAMLDHNGRAVEGMAQPLALHVRVPYDECYRVEPEWLLLVGRSTYEQWKRTEDLERKIGTRRLRGIVSLHDVVLAAGGPARAREIAMGLAKRSIDRWFE